MSLTLDVHVQQAHGLKHTGKHCIEYLLDGHDAVTTSWVDDEYDQQGRLVQPKLFGQAGRRGIRLRGGLERYNNTYLHVTVIHQRMIREDKRAAEVHIPFSQIANGFNGWIELVHKDQFGGKLFIVARILGLLAMQPRSAAKPQPAPAPAASAADMAAEIPGLTAAEIEEQRLIYASIQAAAAKASPTPASVPTTTSTSAAKASAPSNAAAVAGPASVTQASVPISASAASRPRRKEGSEKASTAFDGFAGFPSEQASVSPWAPPVPQPERTRPSRRAKAAETTAAAASAWGSATSTSFADASSQATAGGWGAATGIPAAQGWGFGSSQAGFDDSAFGFGTAATHTDVSTSGWPDWGASPSSASTAVVAPAEASPITPSAPADWGGWATGSAGASGAFADGWGSHADSPSPPAASEQHKQPHDGFASTSLAFGTGAVEAASAFPASGAQVAQQTATAAPAAPSVASPPASVCGSQEAPCGWSAIDTAAFPGGTFPLVSSPSTEAGFTPPSFDAAMAHEGIGTDAEPSMAMASVAPEGKPREAPSVVASVPLEEMSRDATPAVPTAMDASEGMGRDAQSPLTNGDAVPAYVEVAGQRVAEQDGHVTETSRVDEIGAGEAEFKSYAFELAKALSRGQPGIGRGVLVFLEERWRAPPSSESVSSDFPPAEYVLDNGMVERAIIEIRVQKAIDSVQVAYSAKWATYPVRVGGGAVDNIASTNDASRDVQETPSSVAAQPAQPTANDHTPAVEEVEQDVSRQWQEERPQHQGRPKMEQVSLLDADEEAEEKLEFEGGNMSSMPKWGEGWSDPAAPADAQQEVVGFDQLEEDDDEDTENKGEAAKMMQTQDHGLTVEKPQEQKFEDVRGRQSPVAEKAQVVAPVVRVESDVREESSVDEITLQTYQTHAEAVALKHAHGRELVGRKIIEFMQHAWRAPESDQGVAEARSSFEPFEFPVEGSTTNEVHRILVELVVQKRGDALLVAHRSRSSVVADQVQQTTESHATASTPRGVPADTESLPMEQGQAPATPPASQPSPAPASPPLPPWMDWRSFLIQYGDLAVERSPAASSSAVPITGAHEVPVDGPPPQPTGRRRALLIGANYLYAAAQLQGTHNDVESVRSLLVRVGFEDENILCLVDGQADLSRLPTRRNILAALRWLAHAVAPGDTLFFLFSGHGSQIQDPQGSEGAMDDTICPIDVQFAGQITDNQLFESLVRNLPAGARLTALLDCCVPGLTLLLPWTCDQSRGWVSSADAYHTLGDVVCFSLEAPESPSADDLRTLCNMPSGVATTGFLRALTTLAARRAGPVTYLELLAQLREELTASGLGWQPRLTVSQAFDPSKRFFRFMDAAPNGNSQVGLTTSRKHKAPRVWCGSDGVDKALVLAGAQPPPPYTG